jgi:hypothetical protein
LSNGQLTFVALAALAIHLLTLAAVWIRHRPQPLFALNLVVAGSMLAALMRDLKWLRAPVDLPVAALACAELLIVALALAAFKPYSAARVGSWIAFALHLLASGVAVAFVLTFKITRLI